MLRETAELLEEIFKKLKIALFFTENVPLPIITLNHNSFLGSLKYSVPELVFSCPCV